MKILAIVSSAPDGISSVQTGTSLYLLHLLNSLLEIGEVTLLTSGEPQGKIVRPDRLAVRVVERTPPRGSGSRAWQSLRQGVLPAMLAYSSEPLVAYLRSSQVEQFDICVVMDEYAAIFLPAIAKKLPTLVVRHNLVGLSSRPNASGPVKSRLRKYYHHWLAQRFDRWVTRMSDAVVVGTTEGVEHLRRLSPDTHVLLLPTIVSEDALKPETARVRTAGEQIDAVFLGNYKYGPNAEAANWFHDEVVPKLSAEVRRRMRFRFVGPNPLDRKPEHNGTTVEYTGFVDDLDTLLAETDIAFIPLRSGSGVKIKSLTLLGAGLPTVSTFQGVEGLPTRDGEDCLIADDAAGFAAALERMLDPGLRAKLGEAAAETLRRYNREAAPDKVLARACELARRTTPACPRRA